MRSVRIIVPRGLVTRSTLQHWAMARERIQQYGSELTVRLVEQLSVPIDDALDDDGEDAVKCGMI